MFFFFFFLHRQCLIFLIFDVKILNKFHCIELTKYDFFFKRVALVKDHGL